MKTETEVVIKYTARYISLTKCSEEEILHYLKSVFNIGFNEGQSELLCGFIDSMKDKQK